jgi:hypothetical protein
MLLWWWWALARCLALMDCELRCSPHSILPFLLSPSPALSLFRVYHSRMSCSERPFSMGMRHRWFHAVLSVACVAFAAYAAYMLASAIPAHIAARHFRFTPRWAGVAGAADPPRLRSAGLLHNGCDLAAGGGPAAGANLSSVPGGGIVVHLAHPSGIDGWWFEPEAATAAAGAVWVRAEHSADGVQWQAIAYPPWARLAGVASTGPGRTAVNLEAPWQWRLRYSAMVLQALLLLWIFVGGAGTGGLGPVRTGVACWVVMATALAIAGAAVSAGAASSLGWRTGSTGMAIWWLQARSRISRSDVLILQPLLLLDK